MDVDIKPAVQFESLVGWVDRGDRGIMAELKNVSGHPILGNLPVVYTSRVEHVKNVDGRVT